MKKLKLLFFFCLIVSGKNLFAQSSEVIRQYIARYKDIAIEEMQRTGVPAAITLAQGIHETGAGTSDLVISSNNHFGIKCKTEWTGATVYHDDDARGECFRKYNDPVDSYRDHSDFLKNRPYYASLFKLDPTDFEAWAYGLKKAGYATNPKYPQILIKLIKDYDLQEYTMIALNRKPAQENDVVWASNTLHTESSSNALGATVTPAVKKEYPSGNFRINQANVTLITQGTSYLRIAEENGIALQRLFEFNDMVPADIAATDHLLYLQRKRKSGANTFHVVADGETLHDIAQEEGIRMESLLSLNLLRDGMQPAPGEKLYLQAQAPAMPKLATERDRLASAPSPQEEYLTHVVQPKETMYAIARKYSVAVDDLMKWNDLQGTELRTGQQLRINKRMMNGSN
jgi:LysM repeat protein